MVLNRRAQSSQRTGLDFFGTGDEEGRGWMDEVLFWGDGVLLLNRRGAEERGVFLRGRVSKVVFV